MKPVTRPYATINEEHVSCVPLLLVMPRRTDSATAKLVLCAAEGQARQL